MSVCLREREIEREREREREIEGCHWGYTQSLLSSQKAVEDNKFAREKQIEAEKRQLEKKGAGVTKRKENKPRVLHRRQEEDLRSELKQRSEAINTTSLEERLQGNKVVNRLPSPQQRDFRHLLRPSQEREHSASKSLPSNTSDGNRAAVHQRVNEHLLQGELSLSRHQAGRTHESTLSPSDGVVEIRPAGVRDWQLPSVQYPHRDEREGMRDKKPTGNASAFHHLQEDRDFYNYDDFETQF